MPAVCYTAQLVPVSALISRYPQAADTKVVTPKHAAAMLKTLGINYRVVHRLVLRMFLNFAIMQGIKNVKRKMLANSKENKV